MKPLTKSQEKVLRYIADFAREKGFPPSVREIGAALGGIKSSTVAYYIKVLIKKGKLERGSSRARDLRLASPLATYGLSGLGCRGYPILGKVPAGRPNLLEDEVEDTLWLDERLGRSKDSYLCRVKGDSMTGAGIFDGDLLVVRPQKVVETGSIVVAVTPEGEGTVKFLRQKGGLFFLEAANPAYPPISSPFEVAGKVISLVRKFGERRANN
ncbi:MAG: repressor LexA [Elusimicrobia bacterium]|nr:repressor LexA [Elusimicrobiota bacterium]